VASRLHFSGSWAAEQEEAIKRAVKNIRNHKSGIRLLLNRYRTLFRIPENLDHYSREDYRKAERQFLKLALEQRHFEIQEEFFNR
jgi:hypothetical protein